VVYRFHGVGVGKTGKKYLKDLLRGKCKEKMFEKY
jgi:hypothetical protein